MPVEIAFVTVNWGLVPITQEEQMYFMATVGQQTREKVETAIRLGEKVATLGATFA